ncbi:hypothetical protein PI124_g12006 [Phytophthora idaei]|nr:hypothetical protein PI125_g6065 [Phytophthora idaei]KAG3160451.1 hypothetical protein PI126_g6887 [Phytophthora idaei]KAG3243157.1 hypothetical protein PI124_g12006 [Phytophthora idaei]
MSLGEVLDMAVLAAPPSTSANEPKLIPVGNRDLLGELHVTHSHSDQGYGVPSLYLMEPNGWVTRVVHKS